MMEFDLLSLFLIIYLANLLNDFTIFVFNVIVQYYRMRSSRRNMDLLRKNLEAAMKSGVGNDNGGKK
jgi:hypothetical protein|tara:strand:- start:1159 stop:1359 length:201 start_codon:yes stop_codon:yes gene_type:complete